MDDYNTKRMSYNEDEETRQLDEKVEQMLKTIAHFSANAPEFYTEYLKVREQWKANPNTPQELKAIGMLVETIEKNLPQSANVIGNWSQALAAYASYRSQKRQEVLASSVLKSNRIMAWSTTGLAVATLVLAFFAANSVLHLLG